MLQIPYRCVARGTAHSSDEPLPRELAGKYWEIGGGLRGDSGLRTTASVGNKRERTRRNPSEEPIEGGGLPSFGGGRKRGGPSRGGRRGWSVVRNTLSPSAPRLGEEFRRTDEANAPVMLRISLSPPNTPLAPHPTQSSPPGTLAPSVSRFLPCLLRSSPRYGHLRLARSSPPNTFSNEAFRLRKKLILTVRRGRFVERMWS